MVEYNFNNEANFGLECEHCGKQIKRLPCKTITVKYGSITEWIYFHQSCYKKFKSKLKGSSIKNTCR